MTTSLSPMQESLADICVAMSKDIFELNTGRKTTEAERIRVAEYLYKCSTRGALAFCVPLALEPQAVDDAMVERMRAALSVFSKWAVDVATLGELEALDKQLCSVGVPITYVGEWSASHAALQAAKEPSHD
jgi:hypothetical protein